MYIAVDCGPLNNTSNEMVDTSSGTTFINNATYSCDTGYILVGNVTRTCQANAMWSGTAPICNCKSVCNCIYTLIDYRSFLLFSVISLSNVNMSVIVNNSELALSTIGEGVFALSCHTELTTCCRDLDNLTGEALGDWVGPDGNSLPETSEKGFYVTRNMSSVSLNLVEGSSVTAGSYCCRIPRSGGGISTHCIIVAGEEI